MVRQKTKNIEGAFYNVLLENKINDFISSLKWIAGNKNNCIVDIYLEESLASSSFAFDETNYIKKIPESLLKNYKQYINYDNLIYCFSNKFPNDIKEYIPLGYCSTLWSPILLLNECQGFISIHLTDENISEEVLKTLSFFLADMDKG